MFKNFRRGITLLLVLFTLTIGFASAKEDYVYIQYGDTGDPIGWLQDYLNVTETYAYNYSEESIPWFGNTTLDALNALQAAYGMPMTEVFDADTLYFLMGLPYASEHEDPTVWIPMYGGTRYHANYWCSSMVEPRQMPASCAETLGFYPCMKCFN